MSSQIVLLCRFYDRNPDIHQWYYELYGICKLADESSVSTQAGAIPYLLCGKDRLSRVGHSGGPLVIVKNGPVDSMTGCPVVSSPIDGKALVQTLWWYRFSGRDVREVVAEREFERMIHGLDG